MSTDIRNRDFRRRCLEIYTDWQRVGRRASLREVVEAAIASPAPSFYVSPDYAYDKIINMFRKPAMPPATSPRACMWLEIAALVRAEQLRRGVTVSRALSTVLNFRQPSGFHISTREGLRIASGVFERRTEHRPRRSAQSI